MNDEESIAPDDWSQQQKPPLKRLQYWVDSFGVLWKGPLATHSTLHYATLDGIQGDGSASWVLRRTDPPEKADLISEVRAEEIISWFTRA